MHAHIFIFVFFLQFVMFLFCSVFVSFNFPSWYQFILFHLIVENIIFLIFLIIMIIIPGFGMFRNVPGCSGMFHVPGFIDGCLQARPRFRI